MADAQGSGPCEGNLVGVQVPPLAPATTRQSCSRFPSSRTLGDGLWDANRAFSRLPIIALILLPAPVCKRGNPLPVVAEDHHAPKFRTPAPPSRDLHRIRARAR